jgi:hypothetical protein
MSIPEWSFVSVGNKLLNQSDIENAYIKENPDTEDIPLVEEKILVEEKNAIVVRDDDDTSFLYHLFRMITNFFAEYEYFYALFH